MKNIIAGFLLLAYGCKHQTAEQRYVKYINDLQHKIKQQIKIGEVQATIKWLPIDYRKLMSRDQQIDPANNNDNSFYYFDIKFDKTKGDKPGKEKIMYLDFDMQKDFVLLVGKDSVSPVICQKIENGIAGSYQYMLTFEKKEPGSYRMEKAVEDFSVIYNDKIFGIGTIAFVYKQKDIQKIPKLKKEKA